MGRKVKIDKSGLEAFKKKLKSVSGEQRIPLPELMPDAFIKKRSRFESLQAMFDAGNVESPEQLFGDDWNNFISENTDFENWAEMLKAAQLGWVKRKLK